MKYRIEVRIEKVYEFEVVADSEFEARQIGGKEYEEYWPASNCAEVAVFAVTEESES